MIKDPEVLAVPSIAGEQIGMPSAARRVLDDFDAEADRRSARRGYRAWLDDVHAETFGGEVPPEGVPDLLVRLRVAYAIAKEAIERTGAHPSPRFLQNHDAMMAFDETHLTSGMRSMVEAALGGETPKEKATMATTATATKTRVKKPAAAKTTAPRKPKGETVGSKRETIGDRLYEILSRKSVPKDVDIIKELTKEFPKHHLTTTRKTGLAWWINRFVEGTFPGYEDEGPQALRQPEVGPSVIPNGRPRTPRTLDELRAARRSRESGEKPAPKKAAPAKGAKKGAAKAATRKAVKPSKKVKKPAEAGGFATAVA